jgi:hypothetical protein
MDGELLSWISVTFGKYVLIGFHVGLISCSHKQFCLELGVRFTASTRLGSLLGISIVDYIEHWSTILTLELYCMSLAAGILGQQHGQS